MSIVDSFKGKLIVSCQALEGEPLYVPGFMAKMALAAKLGGAVGIRANTPADIKSIKDTVDLPVIGIWKIVSSNSDVYITPSLEAVDAVIMAGADIVALDCTFRKNAEKKWAWKLIKEIKNKYNIIVMADISTLDEGINAEKEGADLISTTLSGYTPYSRHGNGPDFELIRELKGHVKIPVMAEGRIWTTEHAKEALRCGAHGVIVGGAITRPLEITSRFVEALKE